MTRRGFYEDEEVIVTKPGYNHEISSKLKEQEGSHGNVSFVEGMSVRTAPFLEQYTNAARLWLHEKTSYYGAELGTQKSAMINEFNTIKSYVMSTIHEPVLPNIIYVLTGTLTGSILVNRRSLPIRFITPVIFGTASLYQFMPKTYKDIAGRIETFEREKLPEAYKTQNDIIKDVKDLEKKSENQLQVAEKRLTEVVHDVRKYILDIFN